MRLFARSWVALAALTLAGCGAPSQQSASQPAEEPSRSLWFICDALNAPSVIVAMREDNADTALFTSYDMPGGVPEARRELRLGPPQSAHGFTEIELFQADAAIGAVRVTNAAILDEPGAAYTPKLAELELAGARYDCRWTPRTRLFGITETRAYVVHEDADGDLLLTVHNFAREPKDTIELSENAHTTRFDSQLRGGSEVTGARGAEYRFESGDTLTLIIAWSDGTATIEDWRGQTQLARAQMLANQRGDGAPF